jgi:hypothetical protein
VTVRQVAAPEPSSQHFQSSRCCPCRIADIWSNLAHADHPISCHALSVEHKKPRTLTPQWQAATAKYRAMQKQDPIRNM